MDPNETLRRMRAAIRAYRRGERLLVDGTDAGDRAVEYAEDLDKWLSGGGFLPDAWQANLKKWRQAAYNAGRQAEATARYNAGQIGDDKPMSE